VHSSRVPRHCQSELTSKFFDSFSQANVNIAFFRCFDRVSKLLDWKMHVFRGLGFAALIVARILATKKEESGVTDFEGGEAKGPESGEGARVDASIVMLAERSLTYDAALLVEYIDALCASHEENDFDAICLDLLAPAAHKLGEWWATDDVDFLDVTVGIWRLQEAMHILARRRTHSSSANHGRVRSQEQPETIGRVLFSAMPGDNHEFASLMLDELFSASDWHSTALVRPEKKELLECVANEPFDLFGLTLTKDCPSPTIRGLIEDVRGASVNPNIAVMIGGRTINSNPALVAEVGADGTGADARAALDVARTLIQSPMVRAQMR